MSLNIALPPLLAVFDTETNGVDVRTARIVTAFVGLINQDGELIDRHEWFINPGVPIPEGAAAVHGYTDEIVATDDRFTTDIQKAIIEINGRLGIYERRGIPLVIYNAPFDLTLLANETKRHLGEGTVFRPSVVIDPLVIDKVLTKYRSGPGARKLTSVAPSYGVPVAPNAHDAEADCIMTGQVAYAQLASVRMRGLALKYIHERQVEYYAEQAHSLVDYWRSQKAHQRGKGKTEQEIAEAEVTFEWPIIESKINHPEETK